VTPEQAGARMWALVSGLPGDSARYRHLLMLQAYADASGTGDPNILVIAGYLAAAETWREFSKAWKAHLDLAGMSRFKMNEMARSAASLEIAGSFYRIIEEHNIIAGLSTTIRTDHFSRLWGAAEWPLGIAVDNSVGDNSYYAAVKSIVEMLAYSQHKLNISGPVDFIFDDQSEKARIISAWDTMKLVTPPDIRKLMGETPAYRNDDTTMPLQAADLYAWWVHKWEREGIHDGIEDLRFSWSARKRFPRMHRRYGEEEIKEEIARVMGPEELARIAAIGRIPIGNRKMALRDLEVRERGITMTLPDPSSPLS
jgi:hypothetical protein